MKKAREVAGVRWAEAKEALITKSVGLYPIGNFRRGFRVWFYTGPTTNSSLF